MMCGAESRTAMVATKVNRVKVMRQSLFITGYDH